MTDQANAASAGPMPASARGSGDTLAEVLSAAGTKVCALAITLLVLARTDSIARAVAVGAGIAIAYVTARVLLPKWVAQTGPRQVAATADLAGAAVLIAIASSYQHGFALVLVLVLAAVVGVLRGAADLAHTGMGARQQTGAVALGGDAPAGGTEALIVALVCGLVGGLIVGWLGVVAMVWLAAIALAASATLTAWTPPVNGATDPGLIARILEEDTRELAIYRSASSGRVGLRGTLIAMAIENAGQAGALVLVLLWVRGVLAAPAALGLVGGAFVAGAVAGCVASYAGQRAVAIAAAGAVGFAGGAAITLLGGHLPALSGVIACAAYVAGVVFTGKPQRVEVIVDYAGVPQEPVLSANHSAALIFAGLPIAGLVGALVVEHMSTVAGLLVGAALYLVAVGVPMMDRSAPAAEAGAPDVIEPVALRYAGAAAWVAVTLIYSEGAWNVEVERKEGVGEGGHEVKSTDALRAIDILDLPGLREEVETAIVEDQTRAEEETQRLRDELGGVDERLSAIREMVEWSELWRANH